MATFSKLGYFAVTRSLLNGGPQFFFFCISDIDNSLSDRTIRLKNLFCSRFFSRTFFNGHFVKEMSTNLYMIRRPETKARVSATSCYLFLLFYLLLVFLHHRLKALLALLILHKMTSSLALIWMMSYVLDLSRVM